MRQLLRRAWYLIHRDRNESDLADELRFHQEMKEQELRHFGLEARDAELSARRAVGNDLSARQYSRDVWTWPWLQDISQDVRFGFRMLLKDRRFTLAAVIALALGIAVNNSVFIIFNAALLRDLPFDEPHRLVDVQMVDRGGQEGVDYELFEQLLQARSFEGISADLSGSMNLSEPGRPAERMRGTYISASAFRLLRTEPVLGRHFVPADDQPDAPGVAIIGYEMWQQRYGSDPSVVGRAVRINEIPTTLIGVMPPRFGFPLTASVWMPLSHAPDLTTTARRRRNLNVFGRLAEAADLAQANVELQSIAKFAPASQQPDADQRIVVTPLKEANLGGARTFFAVLLGAVAFVLLIACANVASLLLARSANRAREIAIRVSLGASRWRITRQVLIECSLIALCAGTLGFLLSRYGAMQMASAFQTREIGAPDQAVTPYWVDLSMNGIAWMFLGALCVIGSLGIGLIPGWHLAKTNVNAVLKDGGRISGAVRARRWTSALLVGQLALTLVLLTGAGLLIRSYFALYLKDLVIDTTNVVTMRVELPAHKTMAQRKQFVAELGLRLAANPLFASTTVASDIPLQPLSFAGRMLAIEGRTPTSGEKPSPMSFVDIGPRYFETLGLPIVQGRALTESDGQPGREGVIVNQRFAAKFFPDGDAIGHRIQLSGATLPPDRAPWLTIVGIVPTLPNFFPDRMEDPVVYVPMDAEQAPLRVASIIVRSAGRGTSAVKASAANTLREEVAALDPDLPVFAIQTLDEAVALSRYPNQVIGSWFLTLALISLVLATVGLYALTAHGVTQRVQEIGVRMALGAKSRQVVWLFVRRTAIQLALGLTVGLAVALAVGRLLQTFLRETNPRDPLTLTIVILLLIVVALTASLVPSRRAAKVDPAVALRAD
jgi:putative ABC transport system permease protein